MNERIKKLKELASKALKQPDTDNDGLTVFDNDELEKFAELIVWECGVALSPMLRDMVSRGQAYDMINRHFGVEE